MANPSKIRSQNDDPTASDRKKDHIDLAFKAKVGVHDIDHRFQYNPLFAAHPKDTSNVSISFLDKEFKAPIWISSMTGGTAIAKTINKNLAKACGEFGLGMGLGSCRQLLYSDEYLVDFNVRKYMNEQPLYANLGIAQLEQLFTQGAQHRISELLLKLDADGLIIHINPMQEWLQPEGDRYSLPPIDTIMRTLDLLKCNVIVKEVGQGMGLKSLEALMKLPLAAIDFGANGGTNFALLEILRSSEMKAENYAPLANIGHSAVEMVEMINSILASSSDEILCKQIIVSGGIGHFLDGYFCIEKINTPAIYGQASGLLKYAMGDYEVLQEFIELQVQGLSLAKAYLQVN